MDYEGMDLEGFYLISAPNVLAKCNRNTSISDSAIVLKVPHKCYLMRLVCQKIS